MTATGKWHKQLRRRRRNRRRRRPVEPTPEPTLADQLEDMAQRTAQYDRPTAWMDRGTITGKLTFAAWLTRYWQGGRGLRWRLAWEVAKLAFAIIAIYLLVRFL